MLSGLCPAHFGVLFCSVVAAADTYLNLLDCAQGCPVSNWDCVLLIVDPWQYCVCCIRSGVSRCTLLMVLCLDRKCQVGLHAVLWLHIGILMCCLAADPRSIAGLSFGS